MGKLNVVMRKFNVDVVVIHGLNGMMNDVMVMGGFNVKAGVIVMVECGCLDGDDVVVTGRLNVNDVVVTGGLNVDDVLMKERLNVYNMVLMIGGFNVDDVLVMGRSNE
ncbi:hypothetical protein SNE40_005385 [Patella caerulea]|uniref:Uncharacterized protein n=1 Tax=Patella caerulea TaxID=87958 RepID=A0AAN8K2V1_PATCE